MRQSEEFLQAVLGLFQSFVAGKRDSRHSAKKSQEFRVVAVLFEGIYQEIAHFRHPVLIVRFQRNQLQPEFVDCFEIPVAGIFGGNAETRVQSWEILKEMLGKLKEIAVQYRQNQRENAENFLAETGENVGFVQENCQAEENRLRFRRVCLENMGILRISQENQRFTVFCVVYGRAFAGIFVEFLDDRRDGAQEIRKSWRKRGV